MGWVSTQRSGASSSCLPGSASSKPAMRAGPSAPGVLHLLETENRRSDPTGREAVGCAGKP